MGYCRQHRELESQHAIHHQAICPSILTQHVTLLPTVLSGTPKSSSQYTRQERNIFSYPPCLPVHSEPWHTTHAATAERGIHEHVHVLYKALLKGQS